MNREEIMKTMPELEDEGKLSEFSEWMKEALDHFEFKFGEIADSLDIGSLSDLHLIEEAKSIADSCKNDLY